MTTLQAKCPACGAQVNFKTGSTVVVICEYCHSVVARTDRGVEDLGRVAEVMDSGSPLEVGLKGVCRGVAFELTGRAQLAHAAGGTWDEWYASFADGRMGWLAEAQGRFYLTFQRQLPPPAQLPPFDALELGRPVPQIPTPAPLVVAEKGAARALAAEGEIPYRLTPGEEYFYADLAGPEGVFGTVDYGERPPLVFVGREVTLEELGVAGHARTAERAPRRTVAAQLKCPNCAGPLELRAPDQSERVTCPNCGSLLDINQGQLHYLKTLKPVGPAPSIPLGSTAEFDGQTFTVIGFMVRSVEFEGVRYFWQEYLLYQPQTGFRWLVESDAHWSYVRAVSPGDVSEPNEKTAVYGGKRFKVFQNALARVEHVQGEFYWRVAVGELARAVDFVNAPEMLSKEMSGAMLPQGNNNRRSFTGSGEINWSLGTYVPVREIERKFKVDLPAPHTVAPNEPFRHKAVYKYWLLLLCAALAVGVFMMLTSPSHVVFNETYTLLPPTPTPTPTPTPSTITLPNGRTMTLPFPASAPTPVAPTDNEGTQVIFSQPFELKARQNLKVTATANVDNNWLYVEGDFINDETGLVQQFSLPIEYYYGVDGGESWSEGGRDASAYVSAVPAGTYTMRLEAQWEKWNKEEPPRFTVRVEQGAPRVFNLVLVLIALSVVPLLVLFRHFSFEKRRWADSAFNPYDSGDSDDSDDD